MTMPKEPPSVQYLREDGSFPKLIAYIDALRSYAEGLEKFVPDAMRYRWVRSQCCIADLCDEDTSDASQDAWGMIITIGNDAEKVDTAIDAAMKGAERE